MDTHYVGVIIHPSDPSHYGLIWDFIDTKQPLLTKDKAYIELLIQKLEATNPECEYKLMKLVPADE